MLRPLTIAILAVSAIAVSAIVAPTATSGAHAADLPQRSRIGALFADPAVANRQVRAARDEKPVAEPIVTYAPEVDIPSIVHGYYGKPNSYYGRSYYGTPLERIVSRAPYGCGFYGYC